MRKKSIELPEISIRNAGPADLDLLVELGKLSFYEAFSEETAPGDMAEHLHLVVRTPGSHSGNRGSIPLGGTNF